MEGKGGNARRSLYKGEGEEKAVVNKEKEKLPFALEKLLTLDREGSDKGKSVAAIALCSPDNPEGKRAVGTLGNEECALPVLVNSNSANGADAGAGFLSVNEADTIFSMGVGIPGNQSSHTKQKRRENFKQSPLQLINGNPQAVSSVQGVVSDAMGTQYTVTGSDNTGSTGGTSAPGTQGAPTGSRWKRMARKEGEAKQTLKLEEPGKRKGHPEKLLLFTVVGIGIRQSETAELAGRLHSRVDNFPLNYLGYQLGANMKRATAWKPVVDKLAKRLACWKGKFLSIGGRVTLIKSVLTGLPIYLMSLFKVPVGVLKKMRSTIRRFFWNGYDKKSKACLVAWNKISIPKECGGMGIMDLSVMNQCLLFKWIWKFCSPVDGVWKDLIARKYGVRSCSPFPEFPLQKCSLMWRDITLSGSPMSQSGIDLLQGSEIRWGSGSSVCFWSDNWSGRGSLKVLFPRIFSLSLCKAESVQYCLSQESQLPRWLHSWRRLLRDWELSEVEEIKNYVDGISLRPASEDCRVWRGGVSGCYSVRLGRSYIYSSLGFVRHTPFIWFALSPFKTECWLWLALNKGIPTKDALSYRGIATLWGIWLERNRRVFQNEAVDVDRIVDMILVHSAVWIKAIKEDFPFTASTVLSNAETVRSWPGPRRRFTLMAVP
ncbi:hypothetical protein Tsubulata_006579 [Turnera subulata]|uniref:Reverse transcriptase zinc-binding domain-containing protein n=1 Tax=Turnera subulata TaxID=218843 RepID=A0A9Q0G0G4_9ROSI|nr:hypothetical protein Tsubulata_006579 [Turnera subulata]